MGNRRGGRWTGVVRVEAWLRGSAGRCWVVVLRGGGLLRRGGLRRSLRGGCCSVGAAGGGGRAGHTGDSRAATGSGGGGGRAGQAGVLPAVSCWMAGASSCSKALGSMGAAGIAGAGRDGAAGARRCRSGAGDTIGGRRVVDGSGPSFRRDTVNSVPSPRRRATAGRSPATVRQASSAPTACSHWESGPKGCVCN